MVAEEHVGFHYAGPWLAGLPGRLISWPRMALRRSERYKSACGEGTLTFACPKQRFTLDVPQRFSVGLA